MRPISLHNMVKKKLHWKRFVYASLKYRESSGVPKVISGRYSVEY